MNPMYNPHGSRLPEETTFPLADESFDFVIESSLYTHLERLEVVERYVNETARVLRSTGTAYMSFFRSPPNELNAAALRTVFLESDIIKVVEGAFVIEHSEGGTTAEYHDQWGLYLRKRVPSAERTG
jgi:ubiquinone/menaquinone biosynthesis C-methylase UbiE